MFVSELTFNLYIMKNIDKKVLLILNLNKKVQRLNLYIMEGLNAPIFMQKDYKKAIVKRDAIIKVLTNLNYINY